MDLFIEENPKSSGSSWRNELLSILPALIHLCPDSHTQAADVTNTVAEIRRKRQTSVIFVEIWSKSTDFWQLLQVYSEINESRI